MKLHTTILLLQYNELTEEKIYYMKIKFANIKYMVHV